MRPAGPALAWWWVMHLPDAIIEHLEWMAERDDMESSGTLTRYVVIAETISSEDGRRLTYIAHNFQGEGLYPWETMGMVEYFRRHFDTGEE